MDDKCHAEALQSEGEKIGNCIETLNCLLWEIENASQVFERRDQVRQ